MPLTTRCNLCGNQFPVYAQQLRGGRGRVECPRCGESVDALAGLLDEPAFSSGPRASAADGLRRVPGSGGGQSPRGAMVAAAAPSPGRVRSSLSAVSLSARSEPAGSAAARWVWAGVSLVLALLLAGQVLWWQRAEILRDPRGFAAMTTLCSVLGCTVPLARLEGALALREPSLNPDADDGLTLRLRIENTAALPQPAPQLELEFYDAQGDLAAARRFTPVEYGAPVPLAPGESRDLALALSRPRNEVAGFKVRLR